MVSGVTQTPIIPVFPVFGHIFLFFFCGWHDVSVLNLPCWRYFAKDKKWALLKPIGYGHTLCYNALALVTSLAFRNGPDWSL